MRPSLRSRRDSPAPAILWWSLPEYRWVRLRQPTICASFRFPDSSLSCATGRNRKPIAMPEDGVSRRFRSERRGRLSQTCCVLARKSRCSIPRIKHLHQCLSERTFSREIGLIRSEVRSRTELEWLRDLSLFLHLFHAMRYGAHINWYRGTATLNPQRRRVSDEHGAIAARLLTGSFGAQDRR